MKPIERARAELDAAEAQEQDDFTKHVGLVLDTAMKLKKLMVDGGLTAAKAKCPKCDGAESLHGRLIVGQAAGRHRRSAAPSGCGAISAPT